MRDHDIPCCDRFFHPSNDRKCEKYYLRHIRVEMGENTNKNSDSVGDLTDFDREAANLTKVSSVKVLLYPFPVSVTR